MNIGIDISLLKINLAGMGIYVKEMVELFSKSDHTNTYYLFTNAELICDLDVSDNFHIVKEEVNPHIFWLQCRIPQLLKKYHIDIFWQPDHILPPKVKGTKYVVTVHDLSAYKFHNVALKRVEIVQKMFLKKTCKDANEIIAISEYTKNDIIETLHIKEEKIQVIYNGDSPYSKESNLGVQEKIECMDKYGVSKKYFLFVGTINPRKNVITIVKAFNRFREDNLGDAQLVLVGQYGWNSENVLNEIDNSKYKEDIIVTGFVSEKEKEIFYRNAECLMFPSILEGFGFPVLEAFSVGIPVLLSNVSSLPEVGGDAAFYLNDLYDYSEMAKIMGHIFTLDDVERTKVVEKGFKRKALFSRPLCAKQTLDLLVKGKKNS